MNRTDSGGDVTSTVNTGVSVILVQSRDSWQFNYQTLLILSYGAIFATGLVGNSLVILTLTRNQRGKVSHLYMRSRYSPTESDQEYLVSVSQRNTSFLRNCFLTKRQRHPISLFAYTFLGYEQRLRGKTTILG